MILQQKYKDAKTMYKSIPIQNDIPVTVEYIHSLNEPGVSSKKAMLGQNIIALELILGNLEEAKIGLETLTTAAGVGKDSEKEIPVGLLMNWIYFYIRIGDKEKALELIKRRRNLPSMNNERGSLLKLTH